MYIWVVIAVFVVSLASFNVPVRNDMAQITEVPRAEAEILPLIQQHDAAANFIKTGGICKTAPLASPSSPNTIDGKLRDGSTGENISFTRAIKDENSGKLIGTNYKYNGEDIQQMFTCLAAGGNPVDCLHAEKGLLVSFMRIPQEWIENVQRTCDRTKENCPQDSGYNGPTEEKVPNIHLRAALQNRTGGKKLGYTTNQTIYSQYPIYSLKKGEGGTPINLEKDADGNVKIGPDGNATLVNEALNPHSLRDATGIDTSSCRNNPCLVIFEEIKFRKCPDPDTE